MTKATCRERVSLGFMVLGGRDNHHHGGEARQQTQGIVAERAESSCCQPQEGNTEHELQMEAFEASKTAPNGILPLAQTHLLAIPKQSHQPWTNYSKLRIMKRNSFKPGPQVTHSTCKFKTRKSSWYFVVLHAKINPLLSRLKCDKNFPTSSISTVGALHQIAVIIWEVCYHLLTGCMGYIPAPATHFTSTTETLGEYKSDRAIPI